MSLLSPPPISPITAPSEEQKEHEDNKNEVHHLPPKYLAGLSLQHMWVQKSYQPASDFTYFRPPDLRNRLNRGLS
jgi:hypothetical protein